MVRSEVADDSTKCVFDVTGAQLAIATVDGLVRTFDTGTGRLSLTIDSRDSDGGGGPLKEPTTALAWATLPSSEESGVQHSMLVRGSASGSVEAFAASTGQRLWRIQDAHDGPVESAALVDGRVLTCGIDSAVNAIESDSGRISEALTGEAVGVSRRLCSANGGENVLLAGSELYLFSPDLKRRIRWFTGHPMQAHVLATDRSGNFAASSSPGERAIAVWELKPKKKKAQLSAAASLAIDRPAIDAAVASSTSAGGEEGVSVFVASTCSETAHVWECHSVGSNQMKTALCATVRLKNRRHSAQSDGLLAVHLIPTADGATLLLARGTTLKPQFVRIQVVSGSSKDIELPPIQEGLLVPSKREAQGGRRQVDLPQVVGPDVVLPNGFPPSDSLEEDADVEPLSHRKRGAEAEPPSEAMDVEEAAGKGESLEGEAAEVTLGDRVKALRLQHGQGHTQQLSKLPEAQRGSGRERADTLATSLTQALQSGDTSMIDVCLNTVQEAVVKKTVAGLSAANAARLLEHATRLLRGPGSRVSQIQVWVRAIVLRHAAFLMAQGQQQTLVDLQQAIEARLALQQPLSMLLGRLDLLLAQLPTDDLEDPDELRRGPVIHITTQEDDEVEVEDPFAAEAESSGDEEMGSEDEDFESSGSDGDD